MRKTTLKKKNISGNAWVGLLILLVFLITLGLALVTEIIGTIAQSKRAEQIVVAQALAEAGIEKAFWKLNETGGSYIGETDLALSTGEVDITVTNINNENKMVEATGYVPSKTNAKVTRKVRARIAAELNETNASFHYGIQVGGLGITMSNNSSVTGNIYTDGDISCGNNSQITGDAFVSGVGHKIEGCKVGSIAKANSVLSSTITGNLYYSTSKKGSTAAGYFQIPTSELPPTIGMPISQSTIDSWEAWAEAGGVYSGNKTIDATQQTLGPLKIDGDLTVINGATLTVAGVLWVTGNINFSNNAIIKLTPAYGPSSGLIVADNPTDKDTKGKVTVSNNVKIQGSGDPKSYIMIVSTNTGPTTSSPAILAGNNSTAVVYYSTVGMVEVSNNASLRAISGGGLHLSNGAQINYDSGLANANFSGGPGGSWQIKEWQIVY